MSPLLLSVVAIKDEAENAVSTLDRWLQCGAKLNTNGLMVNMKKDSERMSSFQQAYVAKAPFERSAVTV